MVNVAAKRVTSRFAVARGRVFMHRDTLELIASGRAPKGDVLATAHVAGVMAAKRTSEIIPLAHAITLDGIEMSFSVDHDTSSVGIEARVTTRSRTGVEMEALTAVSVAALTVYDMLKAVDRAIVIDSIALHEKSGGKSGHFVRGE